MIFGFRFGKLGNTTDNLSVKHISFDNSTIIVKDQYGNSVVGAKVEISNGTSVFISYTDENGNVELKGKYGNVYVLTISGENIETKIIYDWVFQDNYEIQVDEKPYLEVKPEYIWLTRGNNYTDTVDVMSNVDWFIQ